MSYLIIKGKRNKIQQSISAMIVVLLIASICYGLSEYIGYRTIALILLVSVSFIAILFNITAVLLAAVSSALIWNFFFIPPKFTFHISNAEDTLMFLMYFIIALLNAALTFKLRQVEKKEQKKEEKENTLKLYNTLLNSLSHELRTPIATIIGSTDNLQSNTAKLSEENKNELIHEISKASLRLNRQVENLLNMSRLQSDSINLKKDWCDINELVYGVVHQLKEISKDHRISVQIKENLPLFKLDFGLMEQVLYNLIYNATVYIPKYCVITVRAICKDDNLILMVEDTGKGFAEEDIQYAFDNFYRGKNTKTGGIGLGLSIVKGFIEAHNGTIQLENAVDGGAVFTITIPTETSYLSNLKNE